MTLGIPLFIVLIGGLVMVIGGLMVLVAAFRQSIPWGLAYLFLPFASLVFIIRHWAEAKTGFLTSLVGGVVLVGAMITVPELRAGLGQGASAMAFMGSSAGPINDISGEIQEHRDRIEALENQFTQTGAVLGRHYQELEKRRKSLKTGDEVGIGKFKEDAAVYQKQNDQMKALPQEISAAKEALDALLAKRSKLPAGAPAGGTQRVIMYSMANCGACKMAKEYFAKKGVTYEERDVNQSRAANEEFQSLGGRGVPLILVGDQRMSGFNPQRLDELL